MKRVGSGHDSRAEAMFSDPAQFGWGGNPASPGERQYTFQPGLRRKWSPNEMVSEFPTVPPAAISRTAP